jgi:hypothetical protein
MDAYEYGFMLLVWFATTEVRLYVNPRLTLVTHRAFVWVRKQGTQLYTLLPRASST